MSFLKNYECVSNIDNKFLKESHKRSNGFVTLILYPPPSPSCSRGSIMTSMKERTPLWVVVVIFMLDLIGLSSLSSSQDPKECRRIQNSEDLQYNKNESQFTAYPGESNFLFTFLLIILNILIITLLVLKNLSFKIIWQENLIQSVQLILVKIKKKSRENNASSK